MKKLLFGLGVLAVIALIAVAIGPRFIDWNRYKSEIAARAKAATGRDLAIDGRVSLTLLPAPQLSVQGVRLANLPGAADPDMVRIKSLDVRVAFIPLLAGHLQVESLDLVEPQLSLERLANGRVNWIFVPAAPSEGNAAASADASKTKNEAAANTPGWFAPDHLTITNGVVSYRDDRTGQVETVSQINGGLGAGSSSGPFRAQGHAVAAAVPITFEATLQHLGGGNSPSAVGLKLLMTGAQLDLTGKLVPQGSGTDLIGRLRLSGVDLRSVAAAIAAARPRSLPPFLAQSFGVDASVTASTTKIALSNVALRLGDSEADGGVVFEPGSPDKAALTVSLSRLDLDKWLAMKDPTPPAGGTDLATTLLGDNAPPRGRSAGDAELALKGMANAPAFKLPQDLEATVDANLDAIVYRGDVVRQAHFGATLHKGELVLDQFSVSLPGSSDVTVYGALRSSGGQPSFSGNVEGNADNLRGLLSWLKLDVGQVPAERLRKLSLSAALDLTPQQLELRDVDVMLDSSHLAGGATILLQKRPAFGASVAIDRLNLDAYLPEAAAAQTSVSGSPASGSSGKPGAEAQESPVSSALKPLRFFDQFDANIRARADEVIYRGQDIRGVALDGTVQGGSITLREASVDDLAGIKGTLRGSLAGTADKPSFDMTFDLAAPELATFFRFAQIQTPVPADQIGAVALKGRIKGDPASVTLSGLKAQSALLNAAGDVGFSGMPADLQLTTSLTASTPRLGSLLALAGFANAATLDAFGATQLSLKTGGAPDGFTVDAKLAASGAALAATGKVATAGAPSYDLAVSGSYPDLVGLLRIVAPSYHPAARKLGALQFAAKATGGLDKLTLTDISAKSGPLSVAGTFDAAFAVPRPKFTAQLTAGPVDLNLLLPAAEDQSTSNNRRARGQAAEVSSRWSTSPLDLAALKSSDANVSIAADSLTYDQYTVNGAKLAATLANGVLQLSGLTGKLYGGDVAISGSLDAQDVPKAGMTLRLADANLGAAGLKLGALHLAKGTLGLSSDLTAAGASERAFVQSLNGKGSVKMDGGEIDGFDLAAASARLGKIDRAVDILRLIQAGMSGGTSKINHIAGTFTVTNGVAENKDLAIDADGATGQGQGMIDLPRWYMEYNVNFKLTGANDVPPFLVTLKGAPDAPRKFVNANALQEYLLKRAAGAAAKNLSKGKGAQPPASGSGTGGSEKPSSPQDIIQDILKRFEKKP